MRLTRRRRFWLAALCVAGLSSTLVACGATIGDLGAAEQAKKDLLPPYDGRAQRPSGSTVPGVREDTAGCFVVDLAGELSVQCTGDLASIGGAGSVSKGWWWVGPDGVAVPDAPAGVPSGAWYWVGTDGRMGHGAVGAGTWYWVTDSGVVLTRQGEAGGWYFLTSPDQAQAGAGAPGAIHVTAPGAPAGAPGWYWTPPKNSPTDLPVFGGTGVAPSPPAATPPTAPPASSGSAGTSGSGGSAGSAGTSGSADSSGPSGSPGSPGSPGSSESPFGTGTIPPTTVPCVATDPKLDTSGGVNGRADVDDPCSARIRWRMTEVVDSSLPSYVVRSAIAVADRPGELLVEIDVAHTAATRAITAVRVAGADGFSSFASAEPAPAGVCAQRGVVLALPIPAYSLKDPTASFKAVICSADLAASLLGA